MSGRAAVWAYRLLAALPFRAAQGIGAFAGGLAGAWPSRLRRVAETNLELCMPELDPAARARLARSSLIETGKAAAESSPLLLRAPERALRLVRAVHGEEVLEAALAGGRGAILAVPHLGAWEAVGVYCASRYPMTSMYRPQHRTPALDALLRRGRERAGARLVPSNARGVRALYRGLERGELVGVLPDQNPGGGQGVFAPFFGVAANTMVMVPRLAQRTGAPVVLAYAERLPRGRGFELHFEPGGEAIAQADTAAAAGAMNRALEGLIRRRPEQYWWSYKRFRRRPSGAPRIY